MVYRSKRSKKKKKTCKKHYDAEHKNGLFKLMKDCNQTKEFTPKEVYTKIGQGAYGKVWKARGTLRKKVQIDLDEYLGTTKTTWDHFLEYVNDYMGRKKDRERIYVDRDVNVYVAIKVIDKGFFGRFLSDKELRYAKLMSDHNIGPRVYTTFHSHSYDVIVMEYFSNTFKTLDRMGADDGRTLVEKAIKVLEKQWFKVGLYCVDIKPQNMVFDKETLDVRMIDFDNNFCFKTYKDRKWDLKDFFGFILVQFAMLLLKKTGLGGENYNYFVPFFENQSFAKMSRERNLKNFYRTADSKYTREFRFYLLRTKDSRKKYTRIRPLSEVQKDIDYLRKAVITKNQF